MVSELVYNSINCNGARITVHTTFGTIRSDGRITCLTPAAVLTRRVCSAFSREVGSFPIGISLVYHFEDTTRRGGAVRGLGGNRISVVVKARHVLSGSMRFGSLKLLMVSRRRHFKIARGRGVGRVGIGISILALATAPVPEALRVDLVNVESVDILRRPPVSHMPVRACIVRCGSRLIERTVGERLTEGKRICCICGGIHSVTSVATGLRRLIPSTAITFTRKRVGRARLRHVVCHFVGNRVSILMSAAVVRAKLSVSGIGAVVVRSTSGVKLSRLCRLHKQINESGHATCTFLVCEQGGVLGRITRGHLTTVGRCSSLNDNFGVTVESLRVHNTNGLLNTRRDKRVRTINCSLCYGVLDRTMGRTGNVRSVDSGFSAAISVIASTCVPTNCVTGRFRGLSVCGHVTNVRARRRGSRVLRRLVSEFNRPPGSILDLLHITELGTLTRTMCVARVGRANSLVGLAVFRQTEVGPRGVPRLVTRCGSSLGFGVSRGPCFAFSLGGNDITGGQSILSIIRRLVSRVHGRLVATR